VLPRVALCCSVLQCVAAGSRRLVVNRLQCGIVCCSVVQSVAVRCSVLQCVAMCCSVLQCVAAHSDGGGSLKSWASSSLNSWEFDA